MWTVLCTVFPTSNPSRGRTSSRPWNRSTSDSLSEGLPPVPVKLLGKICKGEFVDMAEMLRDNIEAERHRGSASESSKVSAHRRRETRHPKLDSVFWCVCLCNHKSAPGKVMQLWAYQTVIIRGPSYGRPGVVEVQGGGDVIPHSVNMCQCVNGDRLIKAEQLRILFGSRPRGVRVRPCPVKASRITATRLATPGTGEWGMDPRRRSLLKETDKKLETC